MHITTPKELDTIPSTNSTRLSDAQWDLIKDDVRVEADRIILPGFSLGIKKRDEPWTYTPNEAWEEFWDRLIFKNQINELMKYWKDLSYKRYETWGYVDDEVLFHDLLWMNSALGWSYYMHGDSTNWLRKLQWRPNIWYSLATATPFGPWYNQIIQRRKLRVMYLPSIGIRFFHNREQESEKFKIRLQAE